METKLEPTTHQDTLTERERQYQLARTRAGLADVEAGRAVPLDTYKAELKAHLDKVTAK